MKKLFFILSILCFANVAVFAQFGQNKVQYKDFTWYYIQTAHFDIYFSQNGSKLAEFTANEAEKALASIQNSFKYKINNRISILVYNSTNDFQETNVTDEYLTEGIEGFTELFKNRVVIQFMGSYKEFRHLIHHELTHAVMNDLFFGGTAQNIISNNIQLNIPLWFNEGMAEYQSLGWDVETDMFIRDAAISEYLPDINRLDGYFAYRGGQAVFYYIASKYGKEKIGELINKIKGAGNFEVGFKESIGLTVEELNAKWKKDIKQKYWPDVAIRKEPEDFSKKLTDHKKDGGFYNTSPAISPQGDKIAFLTNRNFFFDLYLMNALDGKIIKRLVKGSRSSDFEELNIVTPGISWSPDGKKIALSAKSSGYDVIYIIDVESADNEVLPVRMDGIKSVSWSPDGKNLAFIGHDASQSDVFIYNFNTKAVTNLTNDIFTDADPAWSSDSKLIYFVSDRRENLSAPSDSFKIYKADYSHTDIYNVDINTFKISRVTNLPEGEKKCPVVSYDGKELLFISDANGINNIYRKSLANKTDSVTTPVTNSLSGLYQLSLSKDSKKMAFSSMHESAFDIFVLNNPFEVKLDSSNLTNTLYINQLKKQAADLQITKPAITVSDSSASPSNFQIYTGTVLDTSKVYGDSVQLNLSNYIFGSENNKFFKEIKEDTTKFKLSDNLDKKGDFVVHKYKVTFSPDIVYANAGYSSLYGLEGTTVLSFSDMLGNHRLIGVTSLQIDLKNSDYGLAYYYLPNRIDYGIEGFHTARFVYLSVGYNDDLFRFRNYGAVFSMSYPLDKFYRFDAGLSYLNVSKDDLSDSEVPSENVHYIIPAVSFIHDNILWGYTAPIEGTRYRFDVMGNPGFTGKDLSFYSVLGDYRTYFRFFYDYSFAFRLAGGASNGNNPQRFYIGGIENWINRKFATVDIPLTSASDFAFLTAALPLRGYDYAQKIGTRYALMNMELRFPFIRYLVTGGLPLFFNNILGNIFLDMGTAWTRDKSLQLFGRNEDGKIVSKDMLMGTGVGARVFFLYFLVRFDVAWSYDLRGFSTPKYYFSLGADF